jgi:hypothetical protein
MAEPSTRISPDGDETIGPEKNLEQLEAGELAADPEVMREPTPANMAAEHSVGTPRAYASRSRYRSSTSRSSSSSFSSSSSDRARHKRRRYSSSKHRRHSHKSRSRHGSRGRSHGRKHSRRHRSRCKSSSSGRSHGRKRRHRSRRRSSSSEDYRPKIGKGKGSKGKHVAKHQKSVLRDESVDNLADSDSDSDEFVFQARAMREAKSVLSSNAANDPGKSLNENADTSMATGPTGANVMDEALKLAQETYGEGAEKGEPINEAYAKIVDNALRWVHSSILHDLFNF